MSLFTNSQFDIFIVQLVLGTDWEGNDNSIELITTSFSEAVDKANQLSLNHPLKGYDYGSVLVSGSMLGQNIKPTDLYCAKLTDQQEDCYTLQLDETAGGLNVERDAVCVGNVLANNLLEKEYSLGERKMLKGGFSSLELHLLR